MSIFRIAIRCGLLLAGCALWLFPSLAGSGEVTVKLKIESIGSMISNDYLSLEYSTDR